MSLLPVLRACLRTGEFMSSIVPDAEQHKNRGEVVESVGDSHLVKAAATQKPIGEKYPYGKGTGETGDSLVDMT